PGYVGRGAVPIWTSRLYRLHHYRAHFRARGDAAAASRRSGDDLQAVLAGRRGGVGVVDDAVVAGEIGGEVAPALTQGAGPGVEPLDALLGEAVAAAGGPGGGVLPPGGDQPVLLHHPEGPVEAARVDVAQSQLGDLLQEVVAVGRGLGDQQEQARPQVVAGQPALGLFSGGAGRLLHAWYPPPTDPPVHGCARGAARGTRCAGPATGWTISDNQASKL